MPAHRPIAAPRRSDRALPPEAQYLGYIESNNLIVEYRYAEDKNDFYPSLRNRARRHSCGADRGAGHACRLRREQRRRRKYPSCSALSATSSIPALITDPARPVGQYYRVRRAQCRPRDQASRTVERDVARARQGGRARQSRQSPQQGQLRHRAARRATLGVAVELFADFATAAKSPQRWPPVGAPAESPSSSHRIRLLFGA